MLTGSFVFDFVTILQVVQDFWHSVYKSSAMSVVWILMRSIEILNNQQKMKGVYQQNG